MSSEWSETGFDVLVTAHGEAEALEMCGWDDGSIEPELAGTVVNAIDLMDLFGDLDPVMLASLRTDADEEALTAALEIQLERESVSEAEQAVADVVALHPRTAFRSWRQRRAIGAQRAA